jgi:hypothetical protein
MRRQLITHYELYYAPVGSSTPLEPVVPARTSNGSPIRDFMARFKTATRSPCEELEEYFKLPPQDFSCNPLHWWRAHSVQFPNLSRLACDILSILGSAVAVERIFSGGRDLISLRRASLKPETIRLMMVSKHMLHQQRQV